MKKILFVLVAVMTLFTACEETYNDKFEGLEAEILKGKNLTPTLELTLASADYSDMGLDDSYFDANNMPADNIPSLLADKFLSYDAGTACKVTFDFSTDRVVNETGAYVLVENDYKVIMGQSKEYFSSQEDANLYITQYLNNEATYAYADVNDLQTVEYVWYHKNVYKYFSVAVDGTTIEVEYDADAYSISEEEYAAVDNTFESFYKVGDAIADLFALATANSHTLPKVYKAKIYKNYDNTYMPFIFDGNNWSEVPESVTEQQTEQYIFTIDNVWVFDPAVKFSISSSDYQMLVDWVNVNKGASFIDSYGNSEFYSGGSAHYNNFNYQVSTHQDYEATFPSDEAEARALLEERTIETVTEMLKIKFPDAVAQVNNVDVLYTVSYVVYDGVDKNNYYLEFQCTAPNTFTYLAGPTAE